MNTTKIMEGANNIMNDTKTEDITLEQARIWALQEKVLENVYNQTKERLKNTKIENITEEDLYILYLTDTLHQEEMESLYKPEIQQLLIKHGFINSLLSKIEYIYDKQTIKDLLASKQYIESNFIIKPVTITEKKVIEMSDVPDLHDIIFHFINKETQKPYSITTWLPIEISNAERYLNEIMINKDNMLVILDSKKDEPVTLVKQ